MPIPSKIQKKYSNSKINICLQILNKRADGFHNINSLFYNIPFYDEIIISQSNSLDFTCNIDLGIEKEENLVYKSAVELLKFVNKSYCAKIELIKNIPSGAGLGGGSANAAKTILALNEFWQLGLSHIEMLDIASKIGSDVPFFIYDSPAAIVSGKGEIIKPIDFNLNCYCLVLFPGIYVSTQNAYGLLNRTEERVESITLEEKIKKIHKLEDIKSILMNDFEKPIFDNYPAMRITKDNLMDLSDGLALMSGSGSAFFALFNDKNQAEYAKEKILGLISSPKTAVSKILHI